MATHEGHRKRIYEKMQKGELLEHEMLEALLFNAVPRQNTNDLAHRLLARFSNIRGIFEAKLAELLEVRGVGESLAAYLFVIGRFYANYYEDTRREKEATYNANTFKDYVRKKYSGLQQEVLDFYLLDNAGKIKAVSRFETSAKDGLSVEIAPADFAKLLLQEQPAGVVAVHNHPSGYAMPSKMDDTMTAQCQTACSFYNVLFCDHLVFGKGGVYSYYEAGRMETISKKYSLGELLKEEEN
ncbi:MAG: RadC family protein [Clostridia bacterium]|nr:RadC family protein [Clostridia bacterium]